MSWARLDDRFPTHPKVAQLTDREFRVHVRVLCYCSAWSRTGEVPSSAFSEIPGLTRKMSERFLELSLWDLDEDGRLHVHDFKEYCPKDPTGAERQKRHRDRNAQRNDSVTESSNGKRNGRVPPPSRTRSRNTSAVSDGATEQHPDYESPALRAIP